ncbi:MAG: Rieske (2Fe-2S) protein, partial [Acidimicrobiia bacterium]|nr:Rieske (2Fe-2S) protein [Acidimicrobiia bacterium]
RDTADAERRVGVAHALGNQLAAAGFAASWLARRKDADGVGRLISLAALASASIAGFLGGHLTYRRGVGVNTTAFAAGPSDWTTIARLAEVPEHQPTAVATDDVVLLVHRRGDDVVVLEDRCTHRGGPLHEGPVERGCIVCPWHDSAFDLATGAVRRGPASMPQPSYDVRVVDGRIEARRDEAGALRANAIGPSSLDQPA